MNRAKYEICEENPKKLGQKGVYDEVGMYGIYACEALNERICIFDSFAGIK